MNPTHSIQLSNPTVRGATAVIGSVLLNLFGLFIVGCMLLVPPRALPPEETGINEVVVSLEELLPELVPQPQAPPKAVRPDQRAFIDTYQNQESVTKPERPAFESDRNTMAAATRLPTTPSDIPAPSMDGTDKIPGINLADHNFADGKEGEIPRSPGSRAGAQPSPMSKSELPETPQEPAPPQQPAPSPPTPPTPPSEAKPDQEMVETEKQPVKEGDPGGAQETIEMAKADLPKRPAAFNDAFSETQERAMEDAEEESMPEKAPPQVTDPVSPFAALKAPTAPPPPPPTPPTLLPTNKPNPAVAPGSKPSMPTLGDADQAAFSPERHINKINGSVSNIGRNPSVDAERTPMGIYKKKVMDSIERRWHMLRQENAAFVSYGSLKLKFEVNRRGHVSDVRIVHKDANEVVTNFSMKAVTTANIPPMPDEIVTLLGDGPLEITYDIIIY